MAATKIGKTKRSTDKMIDDAINRQKSWLSNRRVFTREFLRKFNMYQTKNEQSKQHKKTANQKNQNTLRSYWFPMFCALVVILMAVVVMVVKVNTPVKVIVPPVPEPVIQPVNTEKNIKKISKPSFDLVRIEPSGKMVIAGRTIAEGNVSIVMNHKIVATEHTNKNGEFVYNPINVYKPGNYVISLIDITRNIRSEDSVFVYISENGYKNSVSLLMTKHGSKILQSPELQEGDLIVSKIDYLTTGRMVVTGKALPRLRVSLTLNGKYLGFTRVSDYKNFGMGVNIGKLEPGKQYKINIRLHDSEGTSIANVEHSFIMPKPTGENDTFYVVRRGDCLWVIARNFLRKGILFTMIAEKNNIKNPDLIYPEQSLKIPVK